MTAVVWITGRAATGKSTLLAACRARLRAAGHAPLCLCDEELLFQLKRADTHHAHHDHPDPHDKRRFLFRDGELFDEGLRRISAAALAAIQAGAPALVLVELARGTAQPRPPVDLTWRRALDLIDPRIWPHSLVFRMDAPPWVQRARNRQRTPDGHPHTPEQVLHRLYAHDDPGSLTRAGIATHTIPSTLPADQAAALVIERINASQPPPSAAPAAPCAARTRQRSGHARTSHQDISAFRVPDRVSGYPPAPSPTFPPALTNPLRRPMP